MHLTLLVAGEERASEHEVWVARAGDAVDVEVDGHVHRATVTRGAHGELRVRVDGREVVVTVPSDREATLDGRAVLFEITAFSPGGAPGRHDVGAQGAGVVRPPMAGRITKVLVAEGDAVDHGQPLAVLEAMKMQISVTAPRAGRVTTLAVNAGDVVDAKTVLCEIG